MKTEKAPFGTNPKNHYKGSNFGFYMQVILFTAFILIIKVLITAV